MYLCDIHGHSKISPDCDIPLRDMARAAIGAGLRVFCVTDHCDLVSQEGKPAAFFDWPAAKEQYRAVKAEVGDRLILRLGLELGSAPVDPEAARAILAQAGRSWILCWAPSTTGSAWRGTGICISPTTTTIRS